jgi:minor extracellular serine protease Vpr
MRMQRAHPGIYTTSPDGNGAAIATHATTGLVSAASPASRGEWLVLYANGLGPVAPGVPSGAAPPGLSSTVDPVSVSVGGLDAEVYFAGLAPGFVGLYQVNFRVPPGAGGRAKVPLTLTVAGFQSNVAKLSIQ